jgi:mono/diheme cytochrome c family protein/rhodanese-related sulfurtransferase
VHRALIALLVVGCNSSAAPPPPPKAPPRDATVDADVAHLAGKPLYLALCAPCHGREAQGYAADRAPSLNNPTFLESVTDDYLRRSIELGRPGTTMAAYGQARGGSLDDAAIGRLIDFLRAEAPPAKQLPPVVAGDVPTGAAIYAQRCLSCHGDVTRRGEAIALANPAFQAVATDAFIRYAVANGRPGTKMAPFAGALTDAELDSVARYVRQLGAGPPAEQQLPPPTGTEPLVINPKGGTPKFAPRAEPCPPQAPGEPPCTPDARFVSVDQVAKAFAGHQRMVIIDAREASDWRRVHIPGAVSIPYHELARLAEAPKDGTWIIAYCGCPHHLSGIVVDELRRRGYAHAVVLDEGINEWHRRGLPVTAAPGVTPPLPEPAAH